PHPRWQPAKTWQKPVSWAGRGLGGLFRGLFFGIAWLLVRAWRGLVAVVRPVMRTASDLAMAPYGRAERGYLRLLPAARRPAGKLPGFAGAAIAVTLLVLPRLG